MKKTISGIGATKIEGLVDELLKDNDEMVTFIIRCDQKEDGLDFRDIYREVLFKHFDYKAGCQGSRRVLDMLIKRAYELKKEKERKEKADDNFKRNIIYKVTKEIYSKVDLETYNRIIQILEEGIK